MVKGQKEGNPMANALMVIEPYWNSGTWVFDDEAVELDKEPFVAGIPQMIDELVKDIPNARNGFRLLFSSMPFPNYQLEVTKLSEEYGGHWYKAIGAPGEGWLCPALLKYFETAPERLYVRAEPNRPNVESDPTEVAVLKNRIEELERLVYSLTMENELLKAGDNPPPPEYPSLSNEEL
jgi:hypothetical protein